MQGAIRRKYDKAVGWQDKGFICNGNRSVAVVAECPALQVQRFIGVIIQFDVFGAARWRIEEEFIDGHITGVGRGYFIISEGGVGFSSVAKNIGYSRYFERVSVCILQRIG